MDIKPTQPTQKCIYCNAWLEYPRWRLTMSPAGTVVYTARCACCGVPNVLIINRSKKNGKK